MVAAVQILPGNSSTGPEKAEMTQAWRTGGSALRIAESAWKNRKAA